MIEIMILIIWICLSPIVDGVIYPELFYNRFLGGLPLWVYLTYFGVALLLLLYVYYKKVVVEQ